jgi:hypothetical protein
LILKVVNATTGEVLFESETGVAIAIRVDDHERGRMSANTESVDVYIRDIMADRADIELARSAYGLYAKMRI